MPTTTDNHDDIAALQAELKAIDAQVAQETGSPAELVKLAALRTDWSSAEAQAEQWKARADSLIARIDWSDAFVTKAKAFIENRRFSLRRLEIAGESADGAFAQMLVRFDRGTDAMEQWIRLQPEQVKAARGRMREFRNRQSDAEDRARDLADAVRAKQEELFPARKSASRTREFGYA
jgi:chromosome segregation ATPase